jgi:hypothetical protein
VRAPRRRWGIRRFFVTLLVAALLPDAGLAGQARRTQAPRRTQKPAAPPKPVTPTTDPAALTCPQVLGDGVTTRRLYCDVVIGRDPAGGIIVTLPPHRGPVTLSFDLHNRHTYSDDQIKARRGYHRYTATIGVMAMDVTLLSRAIVQSEFRSAADLVDRIAGGVGPGGVKAVAPTGTESVVVEIGEEEERVSILGEKLTVGTVDDTVNFNAAGRPIAVVSNVTVTYTPAPPAPPASTRKPATTRKPAPR